MILPLKGRVDSGVGGGVGRADLAGAAHLELVSGVVHLHPQDVMVEAMLRGWRAQQAARGLRESTAAAGAAGAPVPGVHQRVPVAVGAGHVDEWTLWMTSEKRLAPSTIRGYQGICGCSASSSPTPATAGSRCARSGSGRSASGADLP